MRASVTAGLAKAVEEVNQYAPAMTRDNCGHEKAETLVVIGFAGLLGIAAEGYLTDSVNYCFESY